MTQSKDERQRKFLLVLPLIVIPFLTMLFVSLGGGKGNTATAASKGGLNFKLPGAQTKDDSLSNKMSFYDQSEKDSLRIKEAQKSDPYYHAQNGLKDSTVPVTSAIAGSTPAASMNYSGFPGTSQASLATNEQAINQRLSELNRQISMAQIPQNAPSTNNSDSQNLQLKQLMDKLNNGSQEQEDPQMKQLGAMLDKIQEIQNPAIARQKLQQQSEKNKGQVFAVNTGKAEQTISTLDNQADNDNVRVQPGFFSLTDSLSTPQSQNAIEAVVDETKTIVNGATVKFRLKNDIYINGVLIPANTPVSGLAQLNGERIEVKISSIRYGKSTFPVSLAVVDLDGLDGIYVPGAITRDVAKESADQSVQNLGLTTYDPSLGAQAASAGIEAAKSLFSRKVRLVKVMVKAGYQVLLKDEKQKQQEQ